MSRIDDSPDLFGSGVGASTNLYVHCEFCGGEHNVEFKGVDPDSIRHEGDSVLWTNFAGIGVAECCFERIENEILSRMPTILRWYASIVRTRRDSIERSEDLIRDIIELLKRK